MRKTLVTICSLAALVALSVPALAHFQTIYTPEMARSQGGTVTLKMVFTHPFDAGHTMDMTEPVEFFMIHKGEKTDLMETLKPITFEGNTNTGKAYEATVKPRRLGDYVFGFMPGPYYEGEEDIYIQQATKMIMNNGGLPTDWDASAGLPTEIMPLDKPYALWTGNVFRGVVMSGGKPVPHAEIEVEFLNHPPVEGKNMFAKKGFIEAPQESYAVQGIKADAHGQFVYGIPHAGWWGFCALGVGPNKTFEGKELSQDAVIWVQAKDPK